jgi:hypothetical protein
MTTHRTLTTLRAVLALAIVTAWLAGEAAAHPLPLRDKLKFQQLPMDQTQIGGQVYWGHDEISTAYGFTGAQPQSYRGDFMADDFADTLSSPVVHVKWWGSYLNNSEQFGNVKKFLIAFEQDVPTPNALGYSYPDPFGPIHSQIVTVGALSPNSGTFTETFKSNGGPPLGEHLYEYNAELSIPFPQLKDTVYWLKIVALVDIPIGVDPNNPASQIPRWGWHNRDYTQQNLQASPAVTPGENLQGTVSSGPVWHFQDDAVSGKLDVNTFVNTANVEVIQSVNQHILTFQPENYVDNWDGQPGISAFSKDLAFELYTTVPEPTSFGLMGVALAAAALRRRGTRAG